MAQFENGLRKDSLVNQTQNPNHLCNFWELGLTAGVRQMSDKIW